jgi:hypothetical protein
VTSTLTLEIEEDPGSSVTVIISPVPVAVLYDVQGRIRRLPQTRAQFDALAEAFLPYVESWTFDQPVDTDGFAALDWNLDIAIINGWLRGVASAPLPLLRRSSDGDPSETPQDENP